MLGTDIKTMMALFVLSAVVGIMSRRLAENGESEAEPGESWELIYSGQVDNIDSCVNY